MLAVKGGFEFFCAINGGMMSYSSVLESMTSKEGGERSTCASLVVFSRKQRLLKSYTKETYLFLTLDKILC